MLLAWTIREQWNSNEFLFGTKHVCGEEQNSPYDVSDFKAISPSEGGFLADYAHVDQERDKLHLRLKESGRSIRSELRDSWRCERSWVERETTSAGEQQYVVRKLVPELRA